MVPARVSVSGHGLTRPGRGGPAARPLYPSLPFALVLQDLQVLLVRRQIAACPKFAWRRDCASPGAGRGCRAGSGRQVALLAAAWRGRCEPGIAGGAWWGRAAPPPAAGSPGSAKRGQRLPRLLAEPAPNAPQSAFGRDGTRCRCRPCGPAAAPALTRPLAPGGTRRAGRRASAGGPRPAPVPARPPPRAVPVPREQCDRHPPAAAGKLEGRRGERGAGAGSGAAPHRSAGKSRRKAAGGEAGARGVREVGERGELRRRAGGGGGRRPAASSPVPPPLQEDARSAPRPPMRGAGKVARAPPRGPEQGSAGSGAEGQAAGGAPLPGIPGVEGSGKVTRESESDSSLSFSSPPFFFLPNPKGPV